MVDQRPDVKYFWQRNVKHMLLVLLVLCSLQSFYAQEDDGVVSLSLPVRNSLKFNRQIIHPTFSFVREQHSHITLYNKREWVQFDDAPETYLAGYAGRFAENIGAGASLFQQNYGVLTTFGGMGGLPSAQPLGCMTGSKRHTSQEVKNVISLKASAKGS